MNRHRALFVLPSSTKPAATVPESVGGGENLGGYILRLENAFYELAQNYYHQVNRYKMILTINKIFAQDFLCSIDIDLGQRFAVCLPVLGPLVHLIFGVSDL